ncbi:MAG: hypothetical protein Q8937_16915 [Bacteroidota bacterium]|nr:hypothetical protein [Bacteroidota bacterium]
MSEFFERSFCTQCEQYSVIIEDDGNVCYGYLMDGDQIIGDIWLYNQSLTPQKTEWKKSEMPLLNTADFFDPRKQPLPIQSRNEINIVFVLSNDFDLLKYAKIYIRNSLVAILKPNAKPGWSTIVTKDGPLALKYESNGDIEIK